MDTTEQYVSNFIKEMSSFNIPEINNKTNFWLVRTESGLLYDPFLNNQYISLGWDKILSEDIESLNHDPKQEDNLKDKIADLYDSKRPTLELNKCKRFISEMKCGDIVMFPDKRNQSIAFAMLGEYYEVSSDNILDEDLFKKRKTSSSFNLEELPHIKRRRISVLKTVEKKYLNPVLFKALSSMHGISDVNSYNQDILSSIYPIYLFDKKAHLVFNVKKENNISAIEYSHFINHFIEVAQLILGDDINILLKTNINSPGNIDFAISTIFDKVEKNSKKITEGLSKKTFSLLIIYILVTGGTFGGIQIKGLAEVINAFNNNSISREMMEVELKNSKLDCIKKEIEIYQELEKINNEKLEEIRQNAEYLDIDNSELNLLKK